MWLVALAAALLPFLFVTIPPLVDAPGHLGQFAIQLAGSDSPLRRYFGFDWGLKLNLGTDLLIEALAPWLGLTRAFWLLVAIIPVLTVAAIWRLARALNPCAAAASWALPFAYSYPFNYGFLNYTLTTALSLLGFALWVELAGRPRLREALFWPLMPLLLVFHAVGGLLLPILIGASALMRHVRFVPHAPYVAADRASLRAFAAEVRPIAGAALLVVAWKLNQPPSGLETSYSLKAKFNAIALGLRDQSRWLDVASMAAILAVPLIGWRLGARYTRHTGALAITLVLLFLVMPSQMDGASFCDMRLFPAVMIAILALQDWSPVPRRAARAIAIGGLALFLVRIAAATAGFVGYERSYAAELPALEQVERGSRVLAFVTRPCRAWQNWRTTRLDHLPAMASVTREAWVNAHWDVGDIHLMQIRYRPSPVFYNDPTQFVWSQACVDRQKEPPRTAEQWRVRRRTIADVMPDLPLDKVDYLWLIQARLPDGPWSRRLVPVWSHGGSALYRIAPAPPA